MTDYIASHGTSISPNCDESAKDLPEMRSNNMPPLQTLPCDCAGCVNRREISDLTERYENRKVYMLSELRGLKKYCAQLDQHSSLLNSQIRVVSELINSNSLPNIPKSIVSEPHSKTFEEETMWYSASEDEWQSAGERRDYSLSLENSSGTCQQQALQSTEDADLSKTLNVSACDGESTLTLYSQLGNQLAVMENSVDQYKDKLEDTLKTGHLIVPDVKSLKRSAGDFSENSYKVDGRSIRKNFHSGFPRNSNAANSVVVARCVSPIQKLHAMKKAFDKNQHIITTQERQLSTASELISRYEQFVIELWSFAGNIIPNTTEEQSTGLTQRLDHLCQCVKQGLADNGLMCKKLDALQQALQAANRENVLLNETVVQLNDHIEELSRQNDKLLHQFEKKNRQKTQKGPLVLSNLSSPRSDISERVENEASSFVVDTRASGDRNCQMNTFFASSNVVPVFIEERNDDVYPAYSPCYQQHCSGKSETQIMTSPAGSFSDNFGSVVTTTCGNDACGSGNTKDYLNNLKLMAKCLVDLKMNVCNEAGAATTTTTAATTPPAIQFPDSGRSFYSNDIGSGVTSGIDAFVRETRQVSSSNNATQATPFYYFGMRSS